MNEQQTPFPLPADPSDEQLKRFHDDVVTWKLLHHQFNPGILPAWSEALPEMERRGLVTLLSGSFTDPLRAEIRRNW
jgi:hypothetical protein